MRRFNASLREGWRRLQMVVNNAKVVSALSPMVEHRLYHAVRTSVGTAAQTVAFRVPATSSQAPSCSLKLLNEEYRRLLFTHRRSVSSNAPVIHYDPVMFEGCRRFNLQLEAEKMLRHDPEQPCAEITGSSTAPLPKDPAVLARFIYTSFSNSPLHARIQADEKLSWVATSNTEHYFIVRLNYRPTRPDE